MINKFHFAREAPVCCYPLRRSKYPEEHEEGNKERAKGRLIDVPHREILSKKMHLPKSK